MKKQTSKNGVLASVLTVVSTLAVGVLCYSIYTRVNLFVCALLLIWIVYVILHRNEQPTDIHTFTNKKAIVASILTESVLLITFYDKYNSGDTQRLVMSWGIPSAVFFVAVGVVLCVMAFYTMYGVWSRIWRPMSVFCTMLKTYRKPLLILAAIFCVSLISIIRADYNYVDDMGRVYQGYQLTGAFSRYTATFFSTFLHANTWLSDISPLPQLIAGILMSISALLVYVVMTDGAPLKTWGIVALVPFGVFPFFLECYSFKYDAPYMMLSVLVALMPLLFKDYHPVKYGLAVMLSTMAMCTIYQASSGVLPIMVVILAFLKWNKGENIKAVVRFVTFSAIGYVLGMLMFRFVLMTPADNNYVQTSIAPEMIISNIITYMRLIYQWLGVVWVAVIAVIVGFFLLVVIRSSKRRRVCALIVAVITLGLMLLFVPGVYSLFEQPLLHPRTVYSMAIVIAAVSIPVAMEEKKDYIGKAMILVLGCFFVSFAFTYGNALHIQKEYTHARLEHVLDDIKEMDVLKDADGPMCVQIIGTIGHPQHLQGVIDEYALLDKLVTIQFRESSWYFGNYELLYFSDLNDKLTPAEDRGMDLVEYDLPMVKDTVYHTIYADSENILIELK